MMRLAKRMVAVVCALILISSSVLQKNHLFVNASDASAVTRKTYSVLYENAIPKAAPEDIPEGYLFAGWYQNEACTKVLTQAGTGWAKYVDENVLSVKAQIMAGTTAETEKVAIRFITTVDSVYYKNVGFDITINGKTRTLTSSEVYSSLYAVGSSTGASMTCKPSDSFSASSAYFATYTILDVPNGAFGTGITVRPYWTTQDGTQVYGRQARKTVDMGIFDTESVDEGMIFTCDSKEYLVSSEAAYSCTSSANYKEGTGALKSLGTGIEWWRITLDKPVDISAYNRNGTLRFWLYVDDIKNLTTKESKNIRIELSSKTADVDEYQYAYKIADLQTGWNEVVVPLENPAVTGTPDMTAIRFFRIFHEVANGDVENVELILDDVRLVSADEKNSIQLLSCDNTEGITVVNTGRRVEVTSGLLNDTQDYKEGAGALELTYTRETNLLCVLRRREKPAELSDYAEGKLHFWLYVNDTDDLNGGKLVVELTSSGTCDQQELQWILPSVKSGWNELELPFSSATTTGTVDFSNINYMRIWLNNANCKEGLMLRLDDVRAIMPGTLFSCDSTKDFSYSDGKVCVAKDDCKEGTGALKCQTNGSVWYQFIKSTASNLTSYKNGRLEFWLYINDTAYIGEQPVVVELGSAGTTDDARIAWHQKASVLKTGWNHISLPLGEPTSKSGDISWTAVNYFQVSQSDVKKGCITMLDGVRAVTSQPQLVQTGYETEDIVIADIIPTEMGYAVDKTGVSDSTAGIQTALNDCRAAGGGTVYLPEGNYKITGTITIPSYVTLRGDWQDPEQGTGYGTQIQVAMAPVDAEYAKSHGVFEINTTAGIVGLTVVYSNQSAQNVQIYPFTFYVLGGMLSTIKNVTVINGYRGIGTPTTKAHESLQIENFKGTFLDCGIELYYSADVGTVKNVAISNKYWKDYGLDATGLDTYTSTYTTGMKLGDVEWSEYANIQIEDCNTAIWTVAGARGSQVVQFVGSFYGLTIKDCVTGIKADYLDPRWGMQIGNGSITVSGNAIENNTSAYIQLCDVNVTGSIYESTAGRVVKDTTDLSSFATNLTASYQKPDDRMLIAKLETTGDQSAKLQAYLDKMYRLGGGVVYVPGGNYYFEQPVRVPAGVELRGTATVATRDGATGGTVFLCLYGDEEDQPEATAFLTLAGAYAGINGIRIVYSENGPKKTNTNKTLGTTYAVRGNGEGVYIVNSMIAAAAYGVDFRNCDHHLVKSVVTACYYNTYRLGGTGGVMADCLQNGTVLVRTSSPYGDTRITENNLFSDIFYPILKKYAHYIILDNATDELLYNNFAYGAMTMLTNLDSENTRVVNLGTDKVGASSAQLVMDGGSLFGVNILRCDTTQSEATDETKDGKYLTAGIASKAYKYIDGTLELHNRLQLIQDENLKKSNEESVILTGGTASYVPVSDGNNSKKAGAGQIRWQKVLQSPVDAASYQNGKLYLQLYINKTAYLDTTTTLNVELGSDTKCDSQELEWAISVSKLNDGWNVLKLDLTKPTGKVGTIDLANIQFLRIYQHKTGQNSALITEVKDVRVEGVPSTKNILTGNYEVSGSGVICLEHYLDTPVNIAGYEEGKLHLELQVSNDANLTKNGSLVVELGSARRYDCEELQWTIPLNELQTGSNSIELPMKDAVKTGNIHMGAIDFVRVYYAGTDDKIVQCLTQIYVTTE